MEEENALKNQQDKYNEILNSQNEEMNEFLDNIIKENCALKRQLILNEIDMTKYKEMLFNSSIKYYNLETGNLNETDKNYFESLRQINIENDRKLNEIQMKYEKTTRKIIDEHNEIINNLKNNSENNSNNNEDNLNNILKGKIDSYETKIKTLQEELFNSEKYSQLIQQKYETLLQENKMIKNKVIEEKNNILFLIDELDKRNKEEINKINIQFKEQSELITQTYISYNNNEKNKEDFIVENILSEKNNLIEKCKELEEENNHLKEENKKLVIENQKYDNLVSSNQIEISSVKNIREEYEKNLKKFEEESLSNTKENLELKNEISELKAKISSLENKNLLLSNSINEQITNINNKNKSIIKELNNQILQLDQEKRELILTKELKDKNENNDKLKIKELKSNITLLTTENKNLKYKITEYESIINSFNTNKN